MPCLLLLFIVQTKLYSQELARPEWSFGANPYYGGVFRYKPEMPKLDLTNLYGIELYANKITNGKRPWQSLYNYPQVGFATEYYHYGVPDEMGEVFSLSTYMDFTSTPRKKHQWRINIGTGLVYSTRRFEAESNPENKAISSKISYILRGTIHHEIQLSESYYFNVNLAFRHYSNGRLNIPNNGMNFPVVGVGLRYVPHPERISYYKDTSYSYSTKWNINGMVSTSWREVLQEDHKQKAYSASLYASKRLSKYNAILLGVDGFIYEEGSVLKASYVYINKKGIHDENYHIDNDGRQLALTLGTELFLGKLSILVQGGAYIYKPQIYYESTWYQRYGLKYYPIDKTFAQLTLKSHSRTADMVEFGLGFSI